MTREYYLRELKYCGTSEDVEILFDQIFDDLESRTCDNCHFIKGKKGYEECGNTYSSVYGGGVDLDFGCNKFERKNAENS